MSNLRSNTIAVPTSARCRVLFGAPTAEICAAGADTALKVALPALNGRSAEQLLAGAQHPVPEHGCTVFRTAETVAGFAVARAGDSLESAAQELYRRVFAATRGAHLYRLWNYVPQINALEGGLENYRKFCRGRSLAFEEQFGAGFQRQLPAASAVGTNAGPLALAFLAGAAVPRHFENPRQVPAFEYPPDYGPRPPSFSRATLVAAGTRRQVFISGTAAIRGHATVAVHHLDGQLPCTVENLQLIAETAGAGANLGFADGWQRTFKVYIRHAADFAAVRQHLERHLVQPGDEVTYLQADLCRADLLVEIEGVLTKDA
jgi:chorismate lyase / 3-hydroxybenzoate synthase